MTQDNLTKIELQSRHITALGCLICGYLISEKEQLSTEQELDDIGEFIYWELKRISNSLAAIVKDELVHKKRALSDTAKSS